MRAFRCGQRKLGGVAFKILPAPKSVVVLKSTTRNPGDLPPKVTVPVGRKADTLPINGTNLADWWADPVTRFPEEEKTFTTVAETAPRGDQWRGSVYRMEYNLPLDRRSVAIESIEFIGSGQCVPILLGVTSVMEW